mmetsp:Transcript_311/g.534  ORF Transcript_311/g.534 Transcript_311/m.534 type:complete len:273 (+) Transcript_311:504-1322(+)
MLSAKAAPKCDRERAVRAVPVPELKLLQAQKFKKSAHFMLQVCWLMPSSWAACLSKTFFSWSVAKVAKKEKILFSGASKKSSHSLAASQSSSEMTSSSCSRSSVFRRKSFKSLDRAVSSLSLASLGKALFATERKAHWNSLNSSLLAGFRPASCWWMTLTSASISLSFFCALIISTSSLFLIACQSLGLLVRLALRKILQTLSSASSASNAVGPASTSPDSPSRIISKMMRANSWVPPVIRAPLEDTLRPEDCIPAIAIPLPSVMLPSPSVL